jgi:hypothetical protein
MSDVEFENEGGAGAVDAGQTAATGGAGNPASGGAAEAGGAVDWRAQFIPEGAPDADKLKSTLGKFKEPVELAKSYVALQAKLSQGGVKVPGEKATPDEISAYRKAVGVPEAVDGYKLTRPQGIAEAKEAESAFLAQAHAAGLSQKQVDAVLGYYWNAQAQGAEAQKLAQQEQQRVADETRAATGRALEDMWGYAKDNNLGRINAFLSPHMAGDGETNFLHLKLADGSFLGDNLPLVKALDAAARMALGDGKFAENDASDKAVSDELAQLEGLRKTDPAAYKKPETQARIMKLIGAQIGAV